MMSGIIAMGESYVMIIGLFFVENKHKLMRFGNSNSVQRKDNCTTSHHGWIDKEPN
mgnify:CR=1